MKVASQKISQFEFIALMASLMAITSLAMDALLPALNKIAEDVGIVNANQNQLLITMMFLGLGLGQLISGPLSDSLGRKPVTYMGFFVFIVASFIAVNAKSLEVMIVARLLQGVGLSAPRTVSMAIVRDSFSGNLMARIMSFVSVIFILVPAIAPSLGKVLLDFYGWRSIFYSQIGVAIIVIFWFAMRQQETLIASNKSKLQWSLFGDGLKFFFNSKQATLYTIILGLISGSFLVFLSTAQKIMGEQYGLEDQFPYLFAAVALTVGISTLLNGFFVVKIGMKRLIMVSGIFFTLISMSYLILYSGVSNPSISVLMAFLMAQFFTIGFLFGNLSALAMEPLGKIAGMGAAINGFLSTLIAVPIATYIGSFLDDTAIPLFSGFFIAGSLAVLLLLYAQWSIKPGKAY